MSLFDVPELAVAARLLGALLAYATLLSAVGS